MRTCWVWDVERRWHREPIPDWAFYVHREVDAEVGPLQAMGEASVEWGRRIGHKTGATAADLSAEMQTGPGGPECDTMQGLRNDAGNLTDSAAPPSPVDQVVTDSGSVAHPSEGSFTPRATDTGRVNRTGAAHRVGGRRADFSAGGPQWGGAPATAAQDEGAVTDG